MVTRRLSIVIIGSAFALGLLCESPLAQDDERILSFRSDIVVREDSSMTVTETISVRARGMSIRRGIYRDFPTKYRDSSGRFREVGFELEEVLRDGRPEAHRFAYQLNGVRIYIGREDFFLPWGDYTYTLKYRTNRQLGFFADHDELYWNVTGTDWVLPIDQAAATVTLPPYGEQIHLDLEAYTGYLGDQGQYYVAEVNDDNQALFTTTHPLSPQQGLTIVVGFPKGIIAEPTQTEQFRFWLEAHQAEIWSMAGLVIIVAFYFVTWLMVGVDPRGGPIAPQDAPPRDLSPAALRYVLRMGSDFTAFTAALTSMAIKGYLRIEVDAAGNHTLVRSKGSEEQLAPEERELGRELFKGRTEVLVDQDNHEVLSGARQASDRSLDAQCRRVYFFLNRSTSGFGMVASVAALVIALLLFPYDKTMFAIGVAFGGLLIYGGVSLAAFSLTGRGWTSSQASPASRIGAVILALVLIAVAILPLGLLTYISSLTMSVVVFGLAFFNALFLPLLPRYTRAGRLLLDQIEGFRMSLAGQGYRLPGATGGHTDEVFKYVPYAIALNIHRQWAQQLERMFRTTGRPPAPHWYYDPYASGFRHEHLTTNLAQSLTSSIASASVAPGSSSGGGGGGFSGGGGGGGGGGGW